MDPFVCVCICHRSGMIEHLYRCCAGALTWLEQQTVLALGMPPPNVYPEWIERYRANYSNYFADRPAYDPDSPGFAVRLRSERRALRALPASVSELETSSTWRRWLSSRRPVTRALDPKDIVTSERVEELLLGPLLPKDIVTSAPDPKDVAALGTDRVTSAVPVTGRREDWKVSPAQPVLLVPPGIQEVTHGGASGRCVTKLPALLRMGSGDPILCTCRTYLLQVDPEMRWQNSMPPASSIPVFSSGPMEFRSVEPAPPSGRLPTEASKASPVPDEFIVPPVEIKSRRAIQE